MHPSTLFRSHYILLSLPRRACGIPRSPEKSFVVLRYMQYSPLNPLVWCIFQNIHLQKQTFKRKRMTQRQYFTITTVDQDRRINKEFGISTELQTCAPESAAYIDCFDLALNVKRALEKYRQDQLAFPGDFTIEQHVCRGSSSQNAGERIQGDSQKLRDLLRPNNQNQA